MARKPVETYDAQEDRPNADANGQYPEDYDAQEDRPNEATYEEDYKPVRRKAKPDNSGETGVNNGDHRRANTRGYHRVK